MHEVHELDVALLKFETVVRGHGGWFNSRASGEMPVLVIILPAKGLTDKSSRIDDPVKPPDSGYPGECPHEVKWKADAFQQVRSSMPRVHRSLLSLIAGTKQQV